MAAEAPSVVSLQAKQRPAADRGLDGSKMTIGIVASRWNDRIISSLVGGAKAELVRLGVDPQKILLVRVPGSYEVVYGAKRLIEVTGESGREKAVARVEKAWAPS